MDSAHTRTLHDKGGEYMRMRDQETTNVVLSCIGTTANTSCVASRIKHSKEKSKLIRQWRSGIPRSGDGMDWTANDLRSPPPASRMGSTRAPPETYGASCGGGSSSVRCSLHEKVRHASSYAFTNASRLSAVTWLGGPSHNPRAASASAYCKQGVSPTISRKTLHV